MMLICINQHLRNTEAQFIEKLSNIEAELKKSVAHKKKSVQCFQTARQKNSSVKSDELFRP